VVEVILSLSGRLPLLVATLAAESPDDPEKVGDPSGKAVERFLKWVEDPKQRQVALDAALPRRLNRDVLAVIVDEEEADALFAWLRKMPFMERRGDCWVYHDVVRPQMLRYKRHESPQGWANVHGQIAEYYEAMREGLGLEEEAGRKDETWQGYALEALYHCLCQAPQTQLAAALNGLLAALKAQRSFARRWAEVIGDAGEDASVSSVQQWGQQLMVGLKAYEEDRYQEASDMFTALLDRADLEARWRAVALDWRGYLHYRADQYEEALAAFNRAIELDPEDTWAIAQRGDTHLVLERYEEALDDFSRAIERAIELDLDYGWAIAGLRGDTYRRLKRYDEALADFNRAIDLKPDEAESIANRGEIYRHMERYEEALDDFDRAIELDPNYAWAIASRGETYREMERYEEALADLNRAIELKPDYAWAITSRGETYRRLKRYDEALADFHRIIELEPDDAWDIAQRGLTYRQMERYDEALADFDRAIELEPDDAWDIAQRGLTYRLMERYDEALADFNRAIELEPDDARVIAIRGLTYRQMERYDDALADLNSAIELKPDDDWAIAIRGLTYGLVERYDEALADFDRAIELKPDDDWYLYSRSLTYRALDQADESQADLTAAIQYARRGYEKNPQDWANTFDLALYHLVAGEAEGAGRLYKEALAGGASSYRIREALYYLGHFLVLFPDHPQAQAMRDLLQEHLQEREELT
jgi:tetratricopeptide (TPR) repeat protein